MNHAAKITKLIADRSEIKEREKQLIEKRALAVREVIVAVLNKKWSNQWRDADEQKLNNQRDIWLLCFGWEVINYDEHKVYFKSLKPGAFSRSPQAEFNVPWKYFRVSNREIAKWARDQIKRRKQHEKDMIILEAEENLRKERNELKRLQNKVQHMEKLLKEKELKKNPQPTR